mmetsp:Transcript_7963/g.9448  ORF Transcript_7963/g.9448 Transcript_7963/m.9448 type:complete len:104 (+) Transcript_7963:163-474(+)
MASPKEPANGQRYCKLYTQENELVKRPKQKAKCQLNSLQQPNLTRVDRNFGNYGVCFRGVSPAIASSSRFRVSLRRRLASSRLVDDVAEEFVGAALGSTLCAT